MKRDVAVLHYETSGDYKIKQSDHYGGYVLSMLKEALLKNASDIHISPGADNVKINFRINGKLYMYSEIENSSKRIFIRDVKKILNLKIEHQFISQDTSQRFLELGINLRVSSRPIAYGEKIVMRLLKNEISNECGIFTKEDRLHDVINDVIHRRQGLVLICGPTGSGKTTTLYQVIKKMIMTDRNIETIEDPIEYYMEGVNQAEITAKMGFQDHLRSLLRQDPDVILVGEVRDEETAKLCMRATQTGHLVFTTLHTSSSEGAIHRLQELGFEKSVLRENLLLVLSQRLYPSMCQKCNIDQGPPLYIRTINREGCDNCHKGVSGLQSSFEFLDREMINTYFYGGKLEYFTLEDDLKRLKLEGIVSTEEVGI